MIRYDTDLGTGWITFAGNRPVRMGLPGTASPDDPGDPPPANAVHWRESLEQYFRGNACLLPRPDLVAGVGRTPLLQAIYERVSDLRSGETATYRRIAEDVGHPRAARAVGAAMARNPLAPLIPCHRVVGSGGALHGYGGGLPMKDRLLRMEAGW